MRRCPALSLVLSALTWPSSGPAADGAPAPCGIYVLDSAAGAYRDTNIRAYPFVDGYVLRPSWATLEPTRGSYDFRTIDRVIDTLEPLGLELTLNVLHPEPAYITDTTGVLKWFDEDARVERFRPVPWDEFALERRDAFIKALGAHRVVSRTLGAVVTLAEHPTLAHLNFGIAGAHNGIRDPVFGPRLSAMDGYSRGRLREAVLRNLRSLTAAFPTKAVFVGFWPIADATANPPLWDDVRLAIHAEFDGTSRPPVGFWQDNLAASRQSPDGPIFGRPGTTFPGPLVRSTDLTSIAFQALQSWVQPFLDPSKTQYTRPSDAIQFAFDSYGSRYVELYVADVDRQAATPEWDSALQAWHDILCER